MAKTIATDTDERRPTPARLKRDLDCWETDPQTGQRALRHYPAGDPVPTHLTDAQRERLAAQGVI